MRPVLRVTLVASAAAAFLALINTSTIYLSMINHGHSFIRLFVWQLGAWSLWAVAAPWIISNSARLRVIQLILLGFGLMVLQWLITALLTVGLQPLVPVTSYSFGDALFVFWQIEIIVNALAFGVLLVGGRAFEHHERTVQLELRKSQLEAELARAQLAALRLEIQPHFLFNTLNSIAALIRTRENDAALSMLIGLSDLMRSTLERPPGQLLPLGDELDHVRRYVDIQRVRFQDRLEVTYQIDRECERVDVPAFVVQPLVENVLRHGLSSDRRPCHVEIGAEHRDGNEVRLWVRDDGAGLPSGFDLERHAGTGLSNIATRLKRLYGAAASLVLRPNSPAGTIVELILPRHKAGAA
jgi:sensor histidine kinase YesM